MEQPNTVHDTIYKLKVVVQKQDEFIQKLKNSDDTTEEIQNCNIEMSELLSSLSILTRVE